MRQYASLCVSMRQIPIFTYNFNFESQILILPMNPGKFWAEKNNVGYNMWTRLSNYCKRIMDCWKWLLMRIGIKWQSSHISLEQPCLGTGTQLLWLLKGNLPHPPPSTTPPSSRCPISLHLQDGRLNAREDMAHCHRADLKLSQGVLECLKILEISPDTTPDTTHDIRSRSKIHILIFFSSQGWNFGKSFCTPIHHNITHILSRDGRPMASINWYFKVFLNTILFTSSPSCTTELWILGQISDPILDCACVNGSDVTTAHAHSEFFSKNVNKTYKKAWHLDLMAARFEFSDLNISAILPHRKFPFFLQIDINGTYIQLKGFVPIPLASAQLKRPPNFTTCAWTCVFLYMSPRPCAPLNMP